MTHIGDMLPTPGSAAVAPQDALDGFVEPAAPTVPRQAMTNALAVIRMLQAAGCKAPFDFNPEDAAPLWAVKLSPYAMDVLIEAAQEWVDAPGTEFPSLGDMETTAKAVAVQRDRRKVADDSPGICEECEGGRYVRVIDATIQVETYASKKARRMSRAPDSIEPEYEDQVQHHMAPCTRCLPDKADLYARGHWDSQHIDNGGCTQCRHYHWPWKYPDPRQAKGYVGAKS